MNTDLPNFYIAIATNHVSHINALNSTYVNIISYSYYLILLLMFQIQICDVLFLLRNTHFEFFIAYFRLFSDLCAWRSVPFDKHPYSRIRFTP